MKGDFNLTIQCEGRTIKMNCNNLVTVLVTDSVSSLLEMNIKSPVPFHVAESWDNWEEEVHNYDNTLIFLDESENDLTSPRDWYKLFRESSNRFIIRVTNLDYDIPCQSKDVYVVNVDSVNASYNDMIGSKDAPVRVRVDGVEVASLNTRFLLGQKDYNSMAIFYHSITESQMFHKLYPQATLHDVHELDFDDPNTLYVVSKDLETLKFWKVLQFRNVHVLPSFEYVILKAMQTTNSDIHLSSIKYWEHFHCEFYSDYLVNYINTCLPNAPYDLDNPAVWLVSNVLCDKIKVILRDQYYLT